METLEGGDGDVGDIGVQLVDAVLVLITLASQSDGGQDRDGVGGKEGEGRKDERRKDERRKDERR